MGAYGGRRDIMEMVAPAGPMYQAGTLSGNPLAMTAGIKVCPSCVTSWVLGVHGLSFFSARCLLLYVRGAGAGGMLPRRERRRGGLQSACMVSFPCA